MHLADASYCALQYEFIIYYFMQTHMALTLLPVEKFT